MTRSMRDREALEGELAAALARLEAIGRLHAPGPVGLCSACMMPHPCPTAETVLGRIGHTDTGGESSRDEK